MTIEEAKAKWLAWHKANVGIHESGENITPWPDKSTMDETAYGFSMQGKAWCDYYYDLPFWELFGFTTGQKMIYQDGTTGGAAVMNSAQFYKNNNAWYSTPELGDQAFDPSLNHTGAVVVVNGDGTIDRIDGNYSDAVTYRSHVPISQHAGFGRPKWSLAADGGESETEEEEKGTEESYETFASGDIVSIKSGATYYNGGTIQSKYLAHKWIIMQVFGDRAVLNKSADGEISGWMSPINTAYLTKEDSASSSSEQTTMSNTSSATSTTTTSSGAWGIVSAMAEKIMSNNSSNSVETGPVILNNTATSTHTYGGRIKNAEGR